MKTKVSVLKEIMDKIYQSTDFDSALAIIKERMSDPQISIHPEERRLIVLKAGLCMPSLVKLQQYVTNSYLKFSKMGVI